MKAPRWSAGGLVRQRRPVARSPRRLLRGTVVGALAATAVVGSAPLVAAAPPAGFTDTLVATVESPTSLAFAPGGRILVTTQFGALRVIANGTLLPEPALDLAPAVCTSAEQGLLGVAVDPAFTANGYVYLYYTRSAAGSCANRVSRFTMTGDAVDPATETVLVDGIPSPAGNHNAGDLHFGKDGYLYVSVGDGSVADAVSLDVSRVTLEAWVRPSAVGGSWRTVVFKERPGGLVYGLYAGNGSGRPGGMVDIGGEREAVGSSALPVGVWSHLAVTFDGSVVRLFVNGAAVGSVGFVGSVPGSSGPLRLGGNSVWGEWFAGLIDEVRVYNRALSQAEIQTDMQTPL
jgi:hypothetical protein